MSRCPLDDDPVRKANLIRDFPKLTADRFTITSFDSESDPENKIYNCIAWAVGKTDAWWWPDPDFQDAFWPEGVPKELTLGAFVQAIATEGFAICDGPELEEGFEKVALYVEPTTREPTHASRQTEDGRWTSKLGISEDIEHDYEALTGDRAAEYGTIALVMKRPRRLRVPATEEPGPAF